MYKFGKATGIARTWGGYKVIIEDKQGKVYMCELKDGDWSDCVFNTEEEAMAEVKRFNEFSWAE